MFYICFQLIHYVLLVVVLDLLTVLWSVEAPSVHVITGTSWLQEPLQTVSVSNELAFVVLNGSVMSYNWSRLVCVLVKRGIYIWNQTVTRWIMFSCGTYSLMKTCLYFFSTDILECSQSTTPCDQLCTEEAGGFSCSCDQPGFQLDQDGRSCIRKFITIYLCS